MKILAIIIMGAFFGCTTSIQENTSKEIEVSRQNQESIGTLNSNCSCSEGIGSSSESKPSLSIEFYNGQQIAVCGYEQDRISINEVLMSEFNVFDCETSKSLVEYDAMQNCYVSFEKGILKIVETIDVPVGEGWEWKPLAIGKQLIFVKENKLEVLDQKLELEKFSLDQMLINDFFTEINNLRSKGFPEGIENIIGKLQAIALTGNKKAFEVLLNLETYFDEKTDGAIAEQWKDAKAIVKLFHNERE